MKISTIDKIQAIQTIDAIDKHILFEIEKNCRIPDVELAKMVKKSKDAVKYRIKRMEDAGIIAGYKTWLDPTKFGYRTATFYFTCKILPRRKQESIDEAMKNPRLYWLGVAEGTWNIALSFFIKDSDELYALKQDLMTRFNDLILDISIASLVSVSVHEKTFLIDKKSKLISFTEKTEFIKMDKLSKDILKILYSDANENIATIAAKLNTTVDKVKQRIVRIESQGIIVKYCAMIDYHKIGYEYYKAFVYLKNSDSVIIDKMYRYFEQSSTIINIVKQLGQWDLELVIFARSFAEYESSIAEFTEKFSDSIHKIDTATMGTDIIYPCKTPLLE